MFFKEQHEPIALLHVGNFLPLRISLKDFFNTSSGNFFIKRLVISLKISPVFSGILVISGERAVDIRRQMSLKKVTFPIVVKQTTANFWRDLGLNPKLFQIILQHSKSHQAGGFQIGLFPL